MKFITSALAALLVTIVSCVITNVHGESKLKDIYNIVVLGNTGVGKSSLLNMFAGSEAFEVGDNAVSETQIASAKVYKFMGKDDGIQLRLIDTQGLSDTGGDSKDMAHIKNMVDYIKTLEEIDMFLICFDGQNPRFTSYAQSTISLFSQIFPDFLFHSALVFNKWIFADANKAINLKKQYQTKFKADYGIDNIPCYFIDSFFNRKMLRDNDDGSQTVRELHPRIQERTRVQVIELVNYLILKENVCDVRKIEPKDTEQTALVKEKDQAKQDLERTIQENKENQIRAEYEQKLKIAEMNAEHQANIARIQAEAQRDNRNWFEKIFG